LSFVFIHLKNITKQTNNQLRNIEFSQ